MLVKWLVGKIFVSEMIIDKMTVNEIIIGKLNRIPFILSYVTLILKCTDNLWLYIININSLNLYFLITLINLFRLRFWLKLKLGF
jgi:hypothetical protein